MMGMKPRPDCTLAVFLTLSLLVAAGRAQAAVQEQSTSSSRSASNNPASSPARGRRTAALARPDAGSVLNGVYKNQGFGFTYRLPAGWVLRTEEMNAPDGDTKAVAYKSAASGKAERVLLAAFSRPPEARGEDVNTSVLIAAESAEAYPGLKEAAQYLAPVTEVAQAQGFEVINEPYEFVVGPKTVVRSDFQRDVGTRMMWQSTLVILERGYAVSFTFLGGNEDEVDDLIEGLSFGAGRTAAR
jgi:hypothetical protein